MTRPLVVVAHGTADPRGITTVERIAERAGDLAGARVCVGYVDVCGPEAREVLTDMAAPVVIPLFLGGGHHVQVDVPQAAALADQAHVTPHLGADPLVAQAAVARLHESGWQRVPGRRQHVLVAAAGSRRATVRAEVDAIAAEVSLALGVPTSAAYVTSGPDGLGARVAALVADGFEVGVANLLIAPGFFDDRLHREAGSSGASFIGPPLGSHEAVIQAVVQRYRDA